MQLFQHISRDLSWLAFNHRVLQEAKDKSVPLYERIKFLAIYSSNLDEFYRVRVASLRSFKDLKKKTRKALDIKPKKELKQIRKLVQEQQQEFGTVFRQEIIPELESHGVFIINNAAYSEAQQQFAKKYFFEKIYPHVRPILLNEGDEMPFLENASLYFIVQFKEDEPLAIVNIPSDKLPRFVELPGVSEGHCITFLDDLLRFNLDELFKRPIDGAFAIKLSRDAEMYIEDEFAGDLLEKIKKGLEERDIGLPTRFLFDSAMPAELLERLKTLFLLSKNDLIPGARYHNFNDFFQFPNPLEDASLHDEPLPPLPHPELEQADSILALIREKDLLLHFPYQKFDYIPRLIREAANDPLVSSIKITLYRVGSKSAVAEALSYACEKGKTVIIFVEAKARFDEEANLRWGSELEKAGANVYYSYPGIKVHTKLLLISRKEEDGWQHYAYIGTGNFNEKTAKLYADHALLTADKRLTNEATQVFDLLERRIIVPHCKHLLVSPFTLRQRFEGLIDKEIANAKAGKMAYMLLKMNSLEDPGMVNKLYEASQAGVRIQIILRGICCLIPGVDGMSENIEVISILDRFLEHARVYIFANGGEEAMYIASADWMTRNLDRRVEVATPIYDPKLFAELRTIIDLQWQDNTKARIIDADLSNTYRSYLPFVSKVRAQADIYHLLQRQIVQLAAITQTSLDNQ
ncbi:MAG: polyphosphate kinase 1 [Saprospiraceae bacterium]|nr:polyphosphate kinase 1 [Saprospiraceae bacterium]